ncbi:MAG: MarR family transcriptional regulator, partial [Alphaproteobacteria bacterium]|nr:MarR family transcriptional regulator [Alphaproteobacteria bacterium]
ERDKRQIHLTLLPDGSNALAGAPDPLQMRFIDRFDALPMWEQAMILAAAEKLAVLMDADTIDAAPLLDGGRIDRSEPH